MEDAKIRTGPITLGDQTGIRVVLAGTEPRAIVTDFHADTFTIENGILILGGPFGPVAAYAPGEWASVDRATERQATQVAYDPSRRGPCDVCGRPTRYRNNPNGRDHGDFCEPCNRYVRPSKPPESRPQR